MGLELYRPSNGTEGDVFQGRFCERCTKAETCDIPARSMAFDVTDAEYPREWVRDKAGNGTCTAFERVPVTSLPENKFAQFAKALKERAEIRTWDDLEDFNPYDHSGGNFDDAYEGGKAAGRAELAREIMTAFGLKYTVAARNPPHSGAQEG